MEVLAHGHRVGREFTIATKSEPDGLGTSPCPLMAGRKDSGLTYRDKDNSNKTPLCIHRAPLGTRERFIGFLIEHYAGNFPLWLPARNFTNRPGSTAGS